MRVQTSWLGSSEVSSLLERRCHLAGGTSRSALRHGNLTLKSAEARPWEGTAGRSVPQLPIPKLERPPSSKHLVLMEKPLEQPIPERLVPLPPTRLPPTRSEDAHGPGLGQRRRARGWRASREKRASRPAPRRPSPERVSLALGPGGLRLPDARLGKERVPEPRSHRSGRVWGNPGAHTPRDSRPPRGFPKLPRPLGARRGRPQ